MLRIQVKTVVLIITFVLGIPLFQGYADVVVAKVNGNAITLQQLHTAKKQIPQLTPISMEQVFKELREGAIIDTLVNAEVEKEVPTSDPEVQEAVKKCTEQARKAIYINRKIEQRIKKEDLLALFEKLMKNYKKQIEAKVRHILVKTEQEAKDIIKKLEQGIKFEEVAKEKSLDPTKKRGGLLGYVVKEELPPELGEHIFILKQGAHTKKPVKSHLGWHIFKVEDRRDRPKPTFEKVEPELRSLVAQQEVLKHLQELKEKAKVERFTITGSPDTEPVNAPAEKK